LFIGGEIHLAIVIVIVSYYVDVDAMVLFIVIVFCVNWPFPLKIYTQGCNVPVMYVHPERLLSSVLMTKVNY